MRKRKIDYQKEIKPIQIKAYEASQLCMADLEKEHGTVWIKTDENEYFAFNGISEDKSILNDSLFLRFMNRSTAKWAKGNRVYTHDIIILKFDYNVNCVAGKNEYHKTKRELREEYYRNGVSITYKRKKDGKTEQNSIHYRMFARSAGKAKEGECYFIRDELFSKAIDFLTMGLYETMEKEAEENPDRTFKIVEMSAYQTLAMATASGYIHIPLENILILKDEEVLSDGMRAAVVKTKERTKNGEPDGLMCCVEDKDGEQIKNVLWDGMGLIDESIFPDDAEGFIYCRSHFFKSCLFRGNIQEFFKDYCVEHNIDYDEFSVKGSDMFNRDIKLSDVKVVISDKSIKWLKFTDLMGGTENKAYKYYRRRMKEIDDCFTIVKTAHKSRWGDLQRSSYQMNNSLPTTDKETLGRVAECSIEFINSLKEDENAYWEYLNVSKNIFNNNEMLIALKERNPEIFETKFFHDIYSKKKAKDIHKLKDSLKQGRLFQYGDNLTIVDNPIAMLLKAVGGNPIDEECFKVEEDGVQCYTPRFAEGERLAAFRSPHNSPNNIIHLHNVYPQELVKYFPKLGSNVIVFNAIGTDTQARLSGHDCDSDFVFTTNQRDLAELARKAYKEYPTIINEVKERGSSGYHFTMGDFATADERISRAQEAIGLSTDAAQLALSYYYNEGGDNKELKECFIILSVIAQIAIDLAKKDFEINVTREIRRIKNLECMQKNELPQFFADTKQQRNGREQRARKPVRMACPMDIMAEVIGDKTAKYATRSGYSSHNKPLKDVLNPCITDKGKRHKISKIEELAREYSKAINALEAEKSRMSDRQYSYLRQEALDSFYDKTYKSLDGCTVMALIVHAEKEENSDIKNIILDFLFRGHREQFLNCFVEKSAKTT